MDENKILIFGAGPSLEDNLKHYKRLGDFPGITIATDGALNKVLEADIIPTYCSTLEDTSDLDKYYNTKIVKEKGNLIKECFISDRVHPNTRKAIRLANIKMSVAGKLRGYITSNVGLFSYLVSAIMLKAKTVYFIGMDHCYPEGQGPPVDRNSELFKYGFTVMWNKYNDEEIILHPAFVLWKEEMDFYTKKYPEVKVYNLTGRGALFEKQYIWKPISNIGDWDEIQ